MIDLYCIYSCTKTFLTKYRYSIEYSITLDTSELKVPQIATNNILIQRLNDPTSIQQQLQSFMRIHIRRE